MKQYTPGPWRWCQGGMLPSGRGRYFPHVHIGNDHYENRYNYLVVNSGADSLDQCDANARLISIAPELVEACEALLDYRARNTLNFQLEKLDGYLNNIKVILERGLQ